MSKKTEFGPESAIALLEDETFQEEISFVWLPGDPAASGEAIAEQLEYFAADPGLSAQSPLTDFALAEAAPLAQMQDIADIDLADLITAGDEILDQGVTLSDLEIPGFETSQTLPETEPEQGEAASPFDQMTFNAAFMQATIVIDDDPGPDSVAF